MPRMRWRSCDRRTSGGSARPVAGFAKRMADGMGMRVFRVLRLAAVLAAGLAALQPAAALQSAAPVADCRADVVQILAGDAAPIRIAVEIADTPAARAQGLMHRRHLPSRSGMLFVYEHP